MGWKHAERMVAKLLGGTRTGCNGESRLDVEHEVWAIEVKQRKTLPTYLRQGMVQAQREAGDKLPLCVLHQVGTRYEDAIVCVRLADWRDWYGN